MELQINSITLTSSTASMKMSSVGGPKAMERRLALQVNTQIYELDSWLNITNWHGVLGNSHSRNEDLLQSRVGLNANISL